METVAKLIGEYIKEYKTAVMTETIGSKLDLDSPIEKQLNLLSNDLFQVRFVIDNDHYIVDAGWYEYPEEEPYFKVQLVNDDYDWGNAFFQKRSYTLLGLVNITKEAIDYLYLKST